ncbi:conserved hypothetical protein [Altererythrobacter sp. B11]|uniref:hypothetical protein n=1 Tax=Altererythrobacter sp. B11 TaxID=2060312 RepID=UPI000DC72DF1|nr:hypothetical protein [Altererythrobacter sp. B11]BBC73069.1 conserved hypothetical protein [Altererythrobacter sp. B11]
MLPMSTPAKRLRRRGVSSTFAMALCLAAAGLIGTVALDAPAQAQNKKSKDDGKPKNSKKFSEAYQPVAKIVNEEGGDYASAKSMLPGVIAAVENDADRFFAGNLSLMLGNKLNDKALQRQGLQMMVDSGQTTPEQVGQFNFFIGNLAYDAKDYDAARTALMAAKQAGYVDPNDNLDPLLAETYFASGQAAQGVTFIEGLAKERKAAGQAVPDQWLLRALQMAYNGKMNQEANDLSVLLVSSNPTQKNWVAALQVVNAINSLDPQAQLDLFRLMRETNSLTERQEFVGYIEAADPRIMSNEVQKVLDAGVAAGALSASDEYYADVKRVVDTRKAQDRAEAPGLVKEAQGAATGSKALSAGDVLLSLDENQQAADMYQMAIDKGGVDQQVALTRLGIAKAKAGDYAGAREALAKVTGPRQIVARAWMAYVDGKA